MDERKALKIKIQKLIICVVLVCSLSVSAFAGTKLHYLDINSLVELPADITRVQKPDGVYVDLVEQELPTEAVWSLSGPLWEGNQIFYGDNLGIEITGDLATGNNYFNGYVWPNGAYIDIEGIAPNGLLNLNYQVSFLIRPGTLSYNEAEQGHVAFVPRYRLLDANYDQVAMVTGSTHRIDFEGADDVITSDFDFSDEILIPEDTARPVKYIELKWVCRIQLNIHADSSLDDGINLYIGIIKSQMSLSYERIHVLTDSELAEKLNDEVGQLSDKLDSAGDILANVPKPDVDHIMKPVDELIDTNAMQTFSKFTTLAAGFGLVSTYLTIVGIVIMFSYALFGKRG